MADPSIQSTADADDDRAEPPILSHGPPPPSAQAVQPANTNSNMNAPTNTTAAVSAHGLDPNSPSSAVATTTASATGAATVTTTTSNPASTGAFPMQVYSFGQQPASSGQPPMRSKRRQVKNACTNCQKACKKCDDARPCLRCVKYGIGEECVDSQRKERKKGVKRGPYKKRDGKTSNSPADPPQPLDGSAVSPQTGLGIPYGAVHMPYIGHVPYPPGAFYPQHTHAPPPSKPGEPHTAYYPPYYPVPVPLGMPPPPPHAPGQEHDANAHLGYATGPPPPFYPTPFVPYGSYPGPYMVPHSSPRPDMPMGTQYLPYPGASVPPGAPAAPMYSRSGQDVNGAAPGNGGLVGMEGRA